MKILILFIFVTLNLRAADYFVAVNGSGTASGTISNPLSLVKALSSTSPAGPGDTIWLRGGTYINNNGFISDLTGTSNSLIFVKPYPGERPMLNGNYDGVGGSGNTLAIRGAWTQYWDLEVMNSFTNRDSVSGRASGIDIGGNHGPCSNVQCINCIVHDVGVGIGIWTGATNSGVFGCVAYNNGYQNISPDRGHGHAIYDQNLSGTHYIWDNILVNTFDVGYHAYGEIINATLHNLDIRGNVVFNSGATDATTNCVANYLVGGHQPATNVVFANNFAFHRFGPDQGAGYAESLVAGYSTSENQDIVIRSNYFANGFVTLNAWTNLVFTNNIVAIPDIGQPCMFIAPSASGTNGWLVDYNTYYSPKLLGFGVSGVSNYAFPAWKAATGFDSHSTLTTNGPSSNVVFVRPNPYRLKRGHIIVYNWENLDNIIVDVSSILSSGDSYVLRNSQDYYNPCRSGVLSGSTIQVPMTNLSVAIPIGRVSAPPATSPQFNTFVLIGATSVVSRVRELHVGQIKKPGTTPADLPGYFIDYVGGSDSNSGTNQSVPWKRHPYMKGFAGGYTHRGGDKFYFKGGVTWPNTCFQMTLIAGGSSAASNDIYGTYPLGWGSGKAIFDLENKYVTNSVGVGNQNSAAILFDGYNFPSGAGVSFITLTNLDIKRFKQHHTGLQFGEAAILKRGHSASNTVVNCWVRDWDMDLITAPGQDGGDVAGIGEKDYVTYQGGWVIDGCMFTQSGSLQRTAGAIHGWFTVTNCLVTDVCNGLFGTVYAYNNVISNIVGATDSSTHENAIYAQFPSVISGNLVHDLDSGASAIYLAPNVNYATNINYTVFNNVVWNCGAQEPISVDQETTIAGGVRIYNNTLVNGGSSCIRVGTKSHIGWVDIKGNHLITSNANPISFNPAFIDSTLVNLSNVVQTPTSATTQGYVIGNRFAPTSVTNITVGAGTNLISFFTTDIRGTNRVNPWDAGAYHFIP